MLRWPGVLRRHIYITHKCMHIQTCIYKTYIHIYIYTKHTGSQTDRKTYNTYTCTHTKSTAIMQRGVFIVSSTQRPSHLPSNPALWDLISRVARRALPLLVHGLKQLRAPKGWILALHVFIGKRYWLRQTVWKCMQMYANVGGRWNTPARACVRVHIYILCMHTAPTYDTILVLLLTGFENIYAFTNKYIDENGRHPTWSCGRINSRNSL